MEHLELRQVECFTVLADTLHFGQAAQRLGITQPHFSHMIRSLEASLDTHLFERTQRRVALTETGRAW